MKTKKSIKQWAIMTLLAFWGMGSFLALSGESIEPVPTREYYYSKVIALASFTLCIIVGKFLYKKGLLPDLEGEE